MGNMFNNINGPEHRTHQPLEDVVMKPFGEMTTEEFSLHLEGLSPGIERGKARAERFKQLEAKQRATLTENERKVKDEVKALEDERGRRGSLGTTGNYITPAAPMKGVKPSSANAERSLSIKDVIAGEEVEARNEGRVMVPSPEKEDLPLTPAEKKALLEKMGREWAREYHGNDDFRRAMDHPDPDEPHFLHVDSPEGAEEYLGPQQEGER
ncbi:MAG: hypothetical protein JWN37_596 [Candidatus Nomurabacteria bacterium]|nr:hypothetical protein [Candidatus Nomurabacteria bacterium]